MMKSEPTQKELQELFHYERGFLFWKAPRKKVVVGNLVGWVARSGYAEVKLNQKIYKLHRLIFKMHNGYMPEFVDHIDCDRLNNKIENLREATASQNKWNQSAPKNNISGIKGVCFDKRYNKWKAYLKVNSKQKNIGYFESIELAAQAVQKARGEQHEQFARH